MSRYSNHRPSWEILTVKMNAKIQAKHQTVLISNYPVLVLPILLVAIAQFGVESVF